jgi:hypothetical protein
VISWNAFCKTPRSWLFASFWSLKLFPASTGALAMADYRAARRQLLSDVRDATILQISPSVVSRSIKLLESNNLRAMNALHVACALEWKPDLFVTSDKRQLAAAQNAGLGTEYLGRPIKLADPKDLTAD